MRLGTISRVSYDFTYNDDNRAEVLAAAQEILADELNKAQPNDGIAIVIKYREPYGTDLSQINWTPTAEFK